MKIEHIESRVVRIPQKKVYKTGVGDISTVENVVVRVTTDNGVEGFGEGSPWPFVTESVAGTKEGVDRYLGPALIGDDPFAIGAIHSKMDLLIHGCSTAKTAIDMALYDIIGKAAGQPVYKLLGGPHRTKLRLSRSLGDQVVSQEVETIKEMLAAGITTFKIKTGILDVDADFQRICALREAAGVSADIRLDYNQSLTNAFAAEILHRACEVRPTFIEQPLPRWDLDGLARLSARVPAPIAVDESLFTIHDALTIAARAAARVYVVKFVKHGGLYLAKLVAAIAEAAGIFCHLSSMQETNLGIAAGLHLGASIKNALPGCDFWIPTYLLDGDLVKNPPLIANGEIHVPEGPGLGVEIDEEALREFTVSAS